MFSQHNITLSPKKRGFHLIDEEILQNLPSLPEVGLMVVHILHTSAGICLNENADPSVRVDFEQIFNKLIPENLPFLTHTLESPDDMPAHIKASLVGSSVQIPIANKSLHLGTWQGVYLCEFRNQGGSRKLVVNIIS